MGRTSAELGNSELATGQALATQRAQRYSRYLGIGIVVAVVLALLVLALVWVIRQRTRRFAHEFNSLSTDYDQLAQQYEALQKTATAEVAVSDEEKETDVSPATVDASSATPAGQEFLEKVEDIVNRQIAEGHVDVEAVAKEMCMSVTTFRRHFTSLVDEKPQAYVMRLRMERARQLLDTHPELTVAEVGVLCGFDDRSNFTRDYKRFYGVTPSEVRGEK